MAALGDVDGDLQIQVGAERGLLRGRGPAPAAPSTREAAQAPSAAGEAGLHGRASRPHRRPPRRASAPSPEYLPEKVTSPSWKSPDEAEIDHGARLVRESFTVIGLREPAASKKSPSCSWASAEVDESVVARRWSSRTRLERRSRDVDLHVLTVTVVGADGDLVDDGADGLRCQSHRCPDRTTSTLPRSTAAFGASHVPLRMFSTTERVVRSRSTLTYVRTCSWSCTELSQ